MLSWAKELADAGTKFILLGIKLDLSEKRVVKFDEAKELAEKERILYLEASAKDGTGVNTLFMEAAGLAIGVETEKAKAKE